MIFSCRGCLISGYNIILSDFSFNVIGWAISRFVHGHFAFGMEVDAEAYLIFIEVVYGVEVTQEGITNQKQILILAWQPAFVDHEVAFALVTLVQILLRRDLEDVVAHLEANWLDFLGDVFAWGLDVAECLVSFAIQLWEAGCPLLPDLLEDIGRYGELGASSVDYCGVARVLSWLLHRLGSIGHSLSFEGPGAEPVWEVLERLQAVRSVDNLRGIVATEEGVRRLVHLLRRNAEADHGVVDDAVVLKGPEVMQLLLAHVLVWRESQDAVRLLSEALRLVESEELEVGALVLLELELDLDEALRVDLQGLDAGVVLPDEALQLGRAVRQLGRGLREDLVRVRLVHVVRLGPAPLAQLVPLHERAREWVVLLELEVARGLIVAEGTRDRQVLRPGIEDDAGWLTDWRAHVDSTHVDGIVPARQGHLQRQIVLVIL